MVLSSDVFELKHIISVTSFNITNTSDIIVIHLQVDLETRNCSI